MTETCQHDRIQLDAFEPIAVCVDCAEVFALEDD